MRILVTGCCGFIGSHCVKSLRETYDLIGLDIGNDTKNYKRLDGADLRIVFRDLSKTASGVLEGVDVVINFAAETFVDHSIKDPHVFINSNILGTFNLLEEARRYKVKKFIHISTDEVYGSREVGFFYETDTLNPSSPYSGSKAAADMLCLAYHKTYGIPIIILRPENNYGTFQHTQKLIPFFTMKALNDEPLPLYGDGKHKRMWLHVDDMCSAVKTVIIGGEAGEIYNVGAGQEKENINVAQKILRILKKPDDMFRFIPDEEARPGHDRRYAVDTTKLKDLGWKPTKSFEPDLHYVINWYKQNDWWLK